MKKTVKMCGLKLVMALAGIVLIFGACAEESNTPTDNTNDGMNFKFVVLSDFRLPFQFLTTIVQPKSFRR